MATPIVDTHVILLPDTPRDWWRQCRRSLEGEPIRLHEVEGVAGHIGKGRAKGFRLGDAPYVSCVDPDDLVIPGAFAACIDALEKHPEACGAYTDELRMDREGNISGAGLWSGRPWNPLLQLEPEYLHHLFVIRRRYVEPHLAELADKWPYLADFVLKGLLTAYGPWVHVDRFGYKWRLHGETAHKKFPVMGLYAARWRIIPTLQRAAYAHRAALNPETDGGAEDEPAPG
jgi:hypothetical protein